MAGNQLVLVLDTPERRSVVYFPTESTDISWIEFPHMQDRSLYAWVWFEEEVRAHSIPIYQVFNSDRGYQDHLHDLIQPDVHGECSFISLSDVFLNRSCVG